MKNGSNFDFSATVFTSLTPTEWDALKRQVVLQAQRDRAEVLRGLVQAMVSWLRAKPAKAWTAVFSQHHPVFPSRHGL